MQKVGSAGRPREFDRDHALEKAVRLFSQYGYEGVSVADLTKAMKISPPSLYAAFGSKAELYRETLDTYQKRPGLGMLSDFQKEGPILEKVEALLRATVCAFTDPSYPAGCMITAGMLYCSAAHENLAETVSGLRREREVVIVRQLEKAASRGELSPKIDAVALGRYIFAVILGISIQARDGAQIEELLTVVEIALKNWPRGQNIPDEI